MRTLSLSKSHLATVLVGPILGLVCSFLVCGGLAPDIILFSPLVGLAFYALPTLFGILVLRCLSDRLGGYERFTVLAGVIALAVSFGLAYRNSVHAWMTSRGPIMGTVLGAGPPPEDFGAQLVVLGSLAIWIASMVVVSLAWKHKRVGKPVAIPPGEEATVRNYLIMDSVVVLVVTGALLSTLLVERRTWSSPVNVVARGLAVLNDKGASPGDRALALNMIERSRDDPQVLEVLRREAREETGENQITAAVALLGRDDMMALSILEKPLLQGGTIEGSVQPTTSHTPSDGFTHVSGFGHIGTWDYGQALMAVRDPAAVPILVRLMAAPNEKTRQGAASALRNIFKLKGGYEDKWRPDWPATVDVPSVNAAMVRALDDDNEMVRYYAVGTLMETHLNPHYPAVVLFQEKETEELNYWKNPVGPDPLAMHH